MRLRPAARQPLAQRRHAGTNRRPSDPCGSRTTLLGSCVGLLLGLMLMLAPAAGALAATEEAVLAGGCFWCLEHDLEDLPGVIDVESGYSGGKRANPTYQEVSGGGTGHQESVRVRFDNTRLRYEALLRAYWRNIDPFDGGGQFCDRGDSYRPVIFTTSATQAVEARNSLVAAARELQRPASSIKVAVRPLAKFWPAETYHQNYARRNGLRYRYYRWACRRDQRLDAVWGVRAREGGRWQGAQAPATPGAAPASASAPPPLAAPPPAAGPMVPAAPLPPPALSTASSAFSGSSQLPGGIRPATAAPAPGSVPAGAGSPEASR